MMFSKKAPIPPRSVVKLIKSDAKTPAWAKDIGCVYRIGYYSKQDGLDVAWLVNEKGEYDQSTDQASFGKYFRVMEVSGERDLFGVNRNILGPWACAEAKKFREGKSR